MRNGDRRSIVRWQFDLTWRLLSQFHLPFLDDRVCLWSPAPGAYTVRQGRDGAWRADWNDEEPDVPSPVTIGWLTWHVLWWWGELLTRAEGGVPRARQDVLWPGSADAVRGALQRVSGDWAALLDSATAADLDRPFAFPWPEPRPFVFAAAWANSELMKNAAEIGAIRHQYLAHHPDGG